LHIDDDERRFAGIDGQWRRFCLNRHIWHPALPLLLK
jgi:hypothetical protein